MTVSSRAMPRDDDRASFLARVLKTFQANVESAGPAAAGSYTLIGSIFLLGGIGYFVDARYDTSPAGVVTGLLLGVAAGLYHLAKMTWRR